VVDIAKLVVAIDAVPLMSASKFKGFDSLFLINPRNPKIFFCFKIDPDSVSLTRRRSGCNAIGEHEPRTPARFAARNSSS
jgi:hypothetical protein